ncbi:MAG TPA: class I SAM-dependent methyltransferase [Rhizomicrobium sp.]
MSSREFFAEYARHRAKEGRGYSADTLFALPYLKEGPLARQWQVRAKSYETLIAEIVMPTAIASRPLDILDLGAGNGWLSYRLARLGHRATALDIRDDDVDGLGAAQEFLRREPGIFSCIAAPFETIPLANASFDIAVFNASLHYARDLPQVLTEAARVVRPDGTLVIMDSPFYDREADGRAMVAEKRARGDAVFGTQSAILLEPEFIEYLTPRRLADATPGLAWRRYRVRYPLWYELRPVSARLRRQRPPSRFDLWTAQIPCRQSAPPAHS